MFCNPCLGGIIGFDFEVDQFWGWVVLDKNMLCKHKVNAGLPKNLTILGCIVVSLPCMIHMYI